MRSRSSSAHIGSDKNVQNLIFQKLSTGEYSGALANLVGCLQKNTHQIEVYYTELKQENWYKEMMRGDDGSPAAGPTSRPPLPAKVPSRDDVNGLTLDAL